MPGEQIGDMPGRVIGDAGEHVGNVELWIDAVELGAFDQRVHRSGAPATGIGAGEQPVFAANRDATQGALGRVVVESEATIIEAAGQRGPAPPHVAEGGGKLGFARQLAHGLVRPDGERLGGRL